MLTIFRLVLDYVYLLRILKKIMFFYIFNQNSLYDKFAYPCSLFLKAHQENHRFDFKYFNSETVV